MGFGDSRIMAITIPSATPMIIDSTVRRSDVFTPSMTGGRNMLSSMKLHWKASFVTSMWTNIAATMARTTIATQRPGCRTGTAVMASGCARSGVVVARDDRGRRLALVLVAVDGEGRLAGALARRLPLGQVLGLLHGPGLDGHLLAAGVVGPDAVGVALLGPPLGAGVEVADHVDLLLALVVDGERRHADLVLARLDGRDELGELGRPELGLQAELGRDSREQVDVPADGRLAVGVEELVRRVGRVSPDHELAVGLDRVRHLGGQRLVDRRGRGGRPRAAAAGVGLVAAAGRDQGHGQGQAEERPAARLACLHDIPPYSPTQTELGARYPFLRPSVASLRDDAAMKPPAFAYHRP